MDEYYTKSNRPKLIHCDSCGEDYAASYRKCPFCGAARASDSSETTTARTASSSSRSGSSANRPTGREGNKVRTNTRGGGYGGQKSPLTMIGITLAIVLVVAAILIVIMVARSSRREKRAEEEAAREAIVAEMEETEDEKEEEPETSVMNIVPNSLSLDQDSLTLSPNGATALLTATPDPAGWVGTVTWTSSDETVAVVSSAGLVTYVSEGTCTIVAEAGGKTAECVVTCVLNVPSAEAEEGTGGGLTIRSFGSIVTDITLSVGESYSLTAEGGDGSDYEWSSEDTGIVSINSATGDYVAVAPGITTVTVTCGDRSGSLTVRVK